MDYVLDTNHWSGLQAANPGIMDRINQLGGGDRLLMTVISQAELFGGLMMLPHGRRKDELRRSYNELLKVPAEILVATPEVAEEQGRIFAELRRKGRPIGAHETWIAAFARVRGATLATSGGDFRWIDALLIEDWSETTV